MGSTRYIMSTGEINRKDNSLCFRRDGKNLYIPIENTKEIYCMSEVSINSKLLDFLAQNNVIVHFFNYYEGYSGTFYPPNQYNMLFSSLQSPNSHIPRQIKRRY